MSKPLFDAIRAIKGAPLTQTDVDSVNAVIGAERAPQPEISTSPIPPAIAAIIIPHLNREEGRIAHAYQDHLKYWTIGVGRLIDKRKGGRLTDPEIDMLLLNDVARFLDAMKDWPAWKAVENDPVRASALLSMCFQLGVAGLAGFKNSLALVAGKHWEKAADNMMQSLWAKQTPARAKRVTDMIRTGKL